MSPNSDQLVDHLNGDTLDCRRSNLRNGSKSDNMRNLAVHRAGQMVGVHFRKETKTYIAAVRLGSFQTKEQAEEAMLMANRLLAPIISP